LRNNQTHKFLVLATVLNLDVWLAVLVDNLEWKMFHILLHFRIGEFTTDETLDIKDTGEVITIPIGRLERRQRRRTHVLCGFAVARLFAESPTMYSVSEKVT